jgi:hypothetical protein
MTTPTAMSPVNEQNRGMVSSIQPIGKERRSKVRHPLMLAARYRTLGREFQSGEGQAVNLSSGAALVASQHELSVGVELEGRMEWPSLLDGWTPFQIVAVGRVVRRGASGFALCFGRYEFRTRRGKL